MRQGKKGNNRRLREEKRKGAGISSARARSSMAINRCAAQLEASIGIAAMYAAPHATPRRCNSTRQLTRARSKSGAPFCAAHHRAGSGHLRTALRSHRRGSVAIGRRALGVSFSRRAESASSSLVHWDDLNRVGVRKDVGWFEIRYRESTAITSVGECVHR